MLLTLQQVGNVNYTGWVLKVQCSTDRELITQLQSQASGMEEELAQWEEDVKSQRENFYELNYYTTLQLLTLRRELGRLKGPGKKAVTISPEVLALLQSISTEVGPSHVISVINKVLLQAKVEPEPKSPLAMELPGDSPKNIEVDDVAGASSDHSLEVDTPHAKAQDSTEDRPTFSEEDLSEELKGYITTIASRVDCDRRLILKAIEVLGKKETRIDYEKWCVENEDNYSFPDDGTSGDEESSASESDSDSSDDELSDDEDEEFSYVSGNATAIG